jgi:hypothetical protein
MPFDHEKLDVYGLAIDFVGRSSSGLISDPEAGLGRGLGRVHGTHTMLRRPKKKNAACASPCAMRGRVGEL